MTVSIIIVTYNSAQFIPALMDSICRQTIFDLLEILILDNGSSDQTVNLCRDASTSWKKPAIIEALGKNYGYPLANNLGVERASGEFVFILNADTWLEPDCMEKLLQAMQKANADAAVPLVAELKSDKIIATAALGFDLTGRPTWADADPHQSKPWYRCFMVGGCGFMFRRDVWKKVGGFDPDLFMYAEDDDISWKLWLSGHDGIQVKNAILHHRQRSPMEVGECAVKDSTRYLSNRNSLVVLAKNAQNLLLLCLPLQILMLLTEAIFFLIVRRNWRFVWTGYLKAIIDAFKMLPHIIEERKNIQQIRRRSDWTMAKLFLRFRINRWDMLKALIRGKISVTRPS